MFVIVLCCQCYCHCHCNCLHHRNVVTTFSLLSLHFLYVLFFVFIRYVSTSSFILSWILVSLTSYGFFLCFSPSLLLCSFALIPYFNGSMYARCVRRIHKIYARTRVYKDSKLMQIALISILYFIYNATRNPYCMQYVAQLFSVLNDLHLEMKQRQ